VQDYVAPSVVEELSHIINLTTLDSMVQPSVPDAEPDLLAAVQFYQDLFGSKPRVDGDAYEALLAQLKLHAVAYPIARLRSGDVPIDAAVDEFKHAFDALFPPPQSAGKKVRTKRPGVPDELAALLKATSAAYDNDEAKRARLVDLYNSLAFGQFQERFAVYIAKFKTSIPTPVLEVVEQDILRGSYLPGGSADQQRFVGTAAAAAAPESAPSPKRRGGKRSAASQQQQQPDAEADNSVAKKAPSVPPRRAEVPVPDAPPTPPRGQ
jgi:hypothetical protein